MPDAATRCSPTGPQAAALDIISRPMAQRRDRSSGWQGMGTGWAIISTLIAGMLVWGLVGYLVDRLTGANRVFTGIGIIVGGALGIYLVYARYGRGDREET
jgi:ATP synthase protein I